MASIERRVNVGQTYCVTPSVDCTVSTLGGTELVNVAAGSQDYFVAPAGTVVVSDAGARLTASRNPAWLASRNPAWLAELRAGLDELGVPYKLAWMPAGEKLVVHTDRADDARLEQVAALLERVMPQNIEVVQYNQSIDIPWRDWTPGFTQVEYLEIDSALIDKGKMNVPCLFESSGTFEMAFSEGDAQNEHTGVFYFYGRAEGGTFYDSADQLWPSQTIDGNNSTGMRPRFEGFPEGRVADYHKMIYFKPNTKVVFKYQDRDVYLNDVYKGTLDASHVHGDFTEPKLSLFSNSIWGMCTIGRMYNVKLLSSSGTVSLYLVPALDPTGAPCMYDTVTRTPYYNQGSGDFLYPGKETEATTYSLRRPITYAQLTEHGVRRLYRVPKGYNGTKEEYAAEYGFKPIVEPPMPLEGYWTPEWRETDTQIICDWVETEPPAEEEINTTEEEILT